MKNVETKFNQLILLNIGYSALFLILGIIIFIKSDMTNNMAGILLGASLLIDGCIEVFSYVEKNHIRFFRPNLIVGILGIVLGIFIMLNPLTMLNILNIGLGIWLLIIGVHRLTLFIELKRSNEASNKLFLASACLLAIMGILIIINPFRSLVITKTIGAFIILSNVININDLLIIKRRSKNILNLFN